MPRITRGSTTPRRCTIAIAVALLGWGGSPAASGRPGQDEQVQNEASICALSGADTAWLQAALDGWEKAAREFLWLDPEPLPWTVLVGIDCVWNLLPEGDLLAGYSMIDTDLTFGGAALAVLGRLHDGEIRLPNGAVAPAGGMAFGSLLNGGETPFFVLALPDVFRLEPRAAANPDLDRIIHGVVSHEIVHTRQLVAVGERVESLQARYELPENINDDIIEDRFGTDPDFRAAFEAERDFLYQAVAASGDDRLRLLAGGLAVLDQRRARFFGGSEEPYAEIEDLFLNMEGVAEWAKARLELADPAGRGLEELLADAVSARNTWSQSEGLALVFLLDALVDGWQESVFPPELASPVHLLQEFLDRGASATGREPVM